MEVFKTDEFDGWLRGLRDVRARAKVNVRIDRLANGNLGDIKPVGSNISELRIHHGPGYRVYFTCRGKAVIVLLAGGDKSTQQNDIRRAIRLAAHLLRES